MMRRQDAIQRLKKVADVSRETIGALKTYENLLRKWNPAINLVSTSTINDIWHRHFLDSAQLWGFCPPHATKWVDLGSGGGFPGLVLATIAKEIAPDLAFVLVESDIRKATFLREVSRALSLNATVHAQRIEALEPQNADVVSARALAPLPKLLPLADRHLGNSGICLFSKGESVETELTDARKYWKFTLEKSPSITGSGGIILKIGGLGRV